MTLPARRLIAAIDTPDRAEAARLITALAPHCGMVKLGLEYFLSQGPAGLIIANENLLFLDLKLHDIPNTVAGAVRSLVPLGIAMLTIHAAGGAAMISAARDAAEQTATAEKRPQIIAVTVLTSLDASALHSTGISGGTTQQVLRLARLALDAGADGLVCAAHELPQLRDAFGEKPVLVVPGIRPAGSPAGDQARTMTPSDAIAAGADYIVVGRPITQAPNPAQAAGAIAAAIAQAIATAAH
jgi:orotidine-5'-phosphate decarboxylase